MYKLQSAACSVVCGLFLALSQGGLVFSAPPSDTVLHEAFDSLLAGVQSDLLGEKLLGSCHMQEDASTPCRVPLESEPADAPERLPFLLQDQEAMTQWRRHFVRHARELYSGDASLSRGAALGASPAEAHASVFWSSRPAVSLGAYRYLQHKMEQRRQGNAPLSWEAHVSPRFSHLSFQDAKVLMGVKPRAHASALGQVAPVAAKLFEPRGELPDSFDARDAFPMCRDVISHVRDQGHCGSCWAVSATASFNDRACIASKGKLQIEFSAQHTTSCCDEKACLSAGCDGGMPEYAWQWFVSGGGIVSGGDFGDLQRHPGQSCWPYEESNEGGSAPRRRRGPVVALRTAELRDDETAKCRKDCLDKAYRVSFTEDKHRAQEAFIVQGNDNIKTGLLEGPLTTTFIVYEDFLLYKGGVYEHFIGEEMGGHAVKLIGWGKEGDKKYWLNVNSWNTTWGDQGYFKIKEGDCAFGNLTTGGTVSVVESESEMPLEL